MSRKRKLTHVQVAEATAQKLPNSKYITADISDEEYRTIVTKEQTYKIENPVTLIFRKGGSTHRVVDANGLVHCYPAPETGKSILQWKAKEGKSPVRL